MSEVYLGRQPILDAGTQLFAYELLCRNGMEEAAPEIPEDKAAASVVLNAFFEIGLENVVGKNLAFIKTTRHFLAEQLYRPLPSNRVILTLPAQIEPDLEVLNVIKTAKDSDFRIALSGFVYRKDLEPLIDLADFIKVDISHLPEDQLRKYVDAFRPRKKTLIAEHVEEPQQFIQCQSAGFKYYKGYYFCKPDVVRQKGMPVTHIGLVELLARVRDPNADLKEIEEIVERNVSLTYRILRCVNSALYSLPRRIESVRHAIALLGLDRIRACLSLSLLADVDDKPHELTVTSLVRARTCQLLARATGNKREEVFFSAGLLSVLDAILDQPMIKVLEKIPLAIELREAIQNREGPAGVALRAAISCERETPDLISVRFFGAAAIRESYVQAIRWVADLDEEFGNVN